MDNGRAPNFAERLLPNPGKNVPYLDAIRGIAVLFVLVRHAWGIGGEPDYSVLGHNLSTLIVMMSSGVDLFFVLSGVLLSARFLKAEALGRPAPAFLEYMKSRILRIGPPYWLVLAIVLVLYTPSMIPNDRIWSNYGAFMVFTHATFMQSLFIVSFGAYMVEAPFWTLTVEMVFYLILPLMVRAFYRFRWWQGVVAAFAMSSLWLYLCRNELDGVVAFIRGHAFGLAYSEGGVRFFLSHQILGYLPHFAIGCAISTILQRRPASIFSGERAGVVYALAGLALLAVSMFVLGRLHILGGFSNPELAVTGSDITARVFYYGESMPFALAYGLLILGIALGPQRVRNVVARPTLTLFGVLGYSIYLIHMPLLRTLNEHAIIAWAPDASSHFIRLFLASLVVVVPAALGLFHVIEKPSMVWAARVREKGLPHPNLSATEREGG
jgi:peptidoglycan/LPS O-acetylase OafA/YrhL